MRRIKPVLLYCSSEERLATLAFILSTRCVRAKFFTATSLKDAKDHAGKQFDCIVMLDGTGVETLIDNFDMAGVILVSPSGFDPRVTHAGRQVPESDMAALLEAMKVVSARKRGPRPHIFMGISNDIYAVTN